LQQQLTSLHREVEGSAFVLALIDGDGVIFQDALLHAGENGGSEAASRLQEAIRSHIAQHLDNSGNLPIIVHVYVSMDKLGQKLASVGLLERPDRLRGFAQSFSVNQPLFSIIDVGQGKERADHRIKEMLRTFTDNPTCKHIIFGGCHDTGYLLNLDQYKHNPAKASRITLLESTLPARGFSDLPNFQRTRFDAVFRTAPLPESRFQQHTSTSPQMSSAFTMSHYQSTPVSATANSFTPSMPPGLPPPGLNNQVYSPLGANANHNNVPQSTPTPGPGTGSTSAPGQGPGSPTTSTRPTPPPTTPGLQSPTGSNQANTNGSSWATVGKTGVTERNISIASAKAPPKRYIIYNENSERLDEPLPYISRTVLQAFTARTKQQSKNFCNSFHINNGKCRNPECPYLHGPKLVGEELLALKYKARSLPCGKPDCENFECYLGHECSNERINKKCPFPTCNLKASHGMNHTPAFKQYEDGKCDILK
jgi:hypothetical protein